MQKMRNIQRAVEIFAGDGDNAVGPRARTLLLSFVYS
jgi:hypothetical protein